MRKIRFSNNNIKNSQIIRNHLEMIQNQCVSFSTLFHSPFHMKEKDHIQDPYSFRCMPQVHGATKDVISHVKNIFTTEVNSVTDNPTIFPEEDKIISAGKPDPSSVTEVNLVTDEIIAKQKEFEKYFSSKYGPKIFFKNIYFFKISCSSFLFKTRCG